MDPQNEMTYKSFKKISSFTVLFWKGSQEEIIEKKVAEKYVEWHRFYVITHIYTHTFFRHRNFLENIKELLIFISYLYVESFLNKEYVLLL